MRAWLTGYFGHRNVGDEALLAAFLRHRPADLQPLVFSDDPAHTRRMHRVPAVPEPPRRPTEPRYDMRYGLGYWARYGGRMIPERFRAKAAIHVGGGMLNDHVPGRVVTQVQRLKALKAARGRVATLAIGVDPIHHAPDRAAIGELDGLLDYCSVRDAASERALRACGLEMPIHVAADLVFALAPDAAPPPRRDGPIAINLRPLFGDPREAGVNKAERRAAFEAGCGRLIDGVRARFGAVTLLPFCDEDEAFMRETGLADRAPLTPFTDDPVGAMGRLGGCSALVGMRFHALLMATLLNLPWAPIVYAPKALALAGELGIATEGLCVGDGSEMPAGDFEPDAVLEALASARAGFDARDFVTARKQAALSDMQRGWAAVSR